MTGKFMIRRRFFIPKDEYCRDYERKDLTPSDYLFLCDYEEDGDEEFFY